MLQTDQDLRTYERDLVDESERKRLSEFRNKQRELIRAQDAAASLRNLKEIQDRAAANERLAQAQQGKDDRRRIDGKESSNTEQANKVREETVRQQRQDKRVTDLSEGSGIDIEPRNVRQAPGSVDRTDMTDDLVRRIVEEKNRGL
jgi:hypothetical protein